MRNGPLRSITAAMILESLDNLSRHACLHPQFPAALAFLRRSDLASLPLGRHDIDGEDLFAVVARDPGRSRDESRLEAHRRYIDIQLVLEGTEEMGWKPLADCTRPAGDYDAQRDLQFFEDPPSIWVPVSAGQAAVFLPHDAHAPLVSTKPCPKVIVKIRVPEN